VKRASAIVLTIGLAFLLSLAIQARDQSRESKRLEACGHVLKEILDIPDGIPKGLLNSVPMLLLRRGQKDATRLRTRTL